MRKLLVKARTRIGVTVIGGAVLVLGAGGFATAAVIDSPATDEVSDVAPVTSVTTEPVETAAPTAAAIPEPQTNAPAPVPMDSPAADTPAVSVGAVTTPEQTNAPEPDAETPPAYDPMAPFTDEAGQTYLPAPEVPAPKLPGEPGYVPPAD